MPVYLLPWSNHSASAQRRKGSRRGRKIPAGYLAPNRIETQHTFCAKSMANESSGNQSVELTPTVVQLRSRLATSLWWIMLLSCVAIVVYSTRYFLVPSGDDHFSRYILRLRLHIAGGMGALLAGPWQFSAKLRARWLNLHRWLGRFYLLEVALGSIAGFAMAMVSEQGWPTHLGFGMLAVLWFFTGLQAYRMVRGGNIVAHRQWMVRNFALTLAAVTLRIYMPLMLFVLHWSFRSSYITVSWVCWVPNLLIAEWFLRRRARRQGGGVASNYPDNVAV